MNAVIESISLASRLTPVDLEQDKQLRYALLQADVALVVKKINQDFAQYNLAQAIEFFTSKQVNGAIFDALLIENSEARQKKVFELDEFIYGDMFDVIDYLETEYGFAEDLYLTSYQQAMTKDFQELWQSKGYSIENNMAELEKFVQGYQQNLSNFIQGIKARDEIVQAFAHQGIFEVARHIDQEPDWYCPCEVIELFHENSSVLIHQAKGFSQDLIVSADTKNNHFDVIFKKCGNTAPYNRASALATMLKQG